MAGVLLSAAHAQDRYPGIGRSATQPEIAAWDIDVRPDFKGLPQGSGTVAQGMAVWEGKCASCHGSFGESNQMFPPIVGGTTKDDIRTGRVASLGDDRQPYRTTMMKLPTLSTLWDYIRRAMPLTAPRSLTAGEVYAVTAYILNMAELVPEDFTLSDRNIAEVQQRLPNRNGMTADHGMWSVRGRPDVDNSICMKDCAGQVGIASHLPDHAPNVHGNLAQQNRLVGPARGIVTAQPVPRIGR
jgi:mono/diheme cytochrome c family protein